MGIIINAPDFKSKIGVTCVRPYCSFGGNCVIRKSPGPGTIWSVGGQASVWVNEAARHDKSCEPIEQIPLVRNFASYAECKNDPLGILYGELKVKYPDSDDI